MCNIWKRLFIGLLAFVVITVIIFSVAVSAFLQDGVHFFGFAAHIQVYQKCYFIEDGKIAGESMFRIKGYAFDDDFTGSMNIDEYPLTAFDVLEMGRATGSRELLILSGSGLTDNWNRYYTVIIPKENTNIIVIQIWEKDKPTIVAVCGNSEEEALANYRMYYESLK